MGLPPHRYRTSLAIWDHTVLPATRHKWMRPDLTPVSISWYTRFTYPGGMEGWVDLGYPAMQISEGWSINITQTCTNCSCMNTVPLGLIQTIDIRHITVKIAVFNMFAVLLSDTLQTCLPSLRLQSVAATLFAWFVCMVDSAKPLNSARWIMRFTDINLSRADCQLSGAMNGDVLRPRSWPPRGAIWWNYVGLIEAIKSSNTHTIRRSALHAKNSRNVPYLYLEMSIRIRSCKSCKKYHFTK